MAGGLTQSGDFFWKGSHHFKNIGSSSFLEQLVMAVNPVLDGNQAHDLYPAHFDADRQFPHPTNCIAELESRKTFSSLVERIALNINIPFTVGGGISTVEDAALLLRAGADKVSVNSAAVRNPSLISDIASRFGSQCVVVAVDAKKENGVWRVTTHGGSRFSDKELFSWAMQAEKLGAGEILFTSMDHDGTCGGYACNEYRRLSEMLDIPVIASGGAGNAEHIVEVLSPEGGCADAALAASIFHYGEVRIPELKRMLAAAGIPVRMS